MNSIVDIMHYPVFSGTLTDITSSSDSIRVFQTINAYSYVMARENIEFQTALQNADILIPDGFPIVLAARFLHKQKIVKIAGADLFFYFMNIMNEQNGSVYFIGSTETTLEKIKERAAIDFPNIKIATYSPPYKAQFSKEESNAMIQAINEHTPDVVFVGMTAPKQEMWVEEHKTEIIARAICSIGAVFDFYAGTVQRAPQWMITAKLEWFYRLLKEPKRMWKRYLVYSPLFFWDLLLYWMNVKK